MSSRRRLQSGLPTWRKSAYLLRYLLGPSFLEGSVSAASRLIYFLFLRTTITCGEETPSDFDRNSGDWSGSKFCNDRCLVARKAQLIKGITDGIEAVLKFLCLPMLGVISDLNGRNTIMAVSLIGLASSLAILSTAAYLKKGTPIFPLCILAYVIQGGVVHALRELFACLMMMMMMMTMMMICYHLFHKHCFQCTCEDTTKRRAHTSTE